LFTPPDPYRGVTPLVEAWEEEEVEVSTGLLDRDIEAVVEALIRSASTLNPCVSAGEVKGLLESMGFTVSMKRVYRALRNLERSGELVYRKGRWCSSR